MQSIGSCRNQVRRASLPKRFILICPMILVMGTGCAGSMTAERGAMFPEDQEIGLLSKRITQLTVNLNGLAKRLSESPPIETASDSTLQELRELDRAGWKLHQKQWALQRDYLLFAQDQIERAMQHPEEKPQLLEKWRQRRQEYRTALEEIHYQRQQLEQQHLETEAHLIERRLQ